VTAVLLVLLASSAAASPAPQPSLEAASVLPPAAGAPGAVPLSEPVAPVPRGMPAWSLSASVLGGVADPFYDKVAAWIAARRGFGPFAVEAFGGKAFSWAGPSLSLCSAQAQCSSPGSSRLGATPGNLGFLGGASAVWRFAEGKISASGAAEGRFGMEVSLGAAAVQYIVTDPTWRSYAAPAGRGAIGVEVKFARRFAVRIDFQDLFYATDIRGDRGIENQLLAGGTFSVAFGGR